MASAEVTNAEWWVEFYRWFRLVSALIVAIGVIGEFAGEFLVRKHDKIVDDYKNARIASSEAETAKANLELAKIKQPRELSEQQKTTLINTMKQFSGTPFDTALQTGSETALLMNQIGSSLREAGLDWRPWTDPGKPIFQQATFPQSGIVVLRGIAIEIDDTRVSAWEPAVQTLTATLRSFGLEVRAAHNTGSAPPAAVHVYVGEKPM